MLKRLTVFMALILCGTYAAAAITTVAPVSKTIETGSTLEIGTIQPGETINLVLSTDTNYGKSKIWASASVEASPQGWKIAGDSTTSKTISLSITAPRTSPEIPRNIKIVLDNTAQHLNPEHFFAKIRVKQNLLTASISGPGRDAVVGSSVKFKLRLINDSSAPHTVTLGSTLPESWFKPRTFEVAPKSTLDEELEVLPMVYGKRGFKFTAKSSLNNSELGAFEASLAVKPTFRSKYSPALSGFPFFSIALLPHYAFNAISSLLIP